MWKAIPGFEGEYEVSNLGNIKSLAKTVWYGKNKRVWRNTPDKILNPYINKCGRRDGYRQVHLSGKVRFYVHRLVAQVFIENPRNLKIINHIDGDTLNNKWVNLEWCTYSENRIHSRDKLNHGISGKLALDLSTGIYYESLNQAFQARKHPVQFSQFTLMLRNIYPNICNVILI